MPCHNKFPPLWDTIITILFGYFHYCEAKKLNVTCDITFFYTENVFILLLTGLVRKSLRLALENSCVIGQKFGVGVARLLHRWCKN